jgi:hypothetical protein
MRILLLPLESGGATHTKTNNRVVITRLRRSKSHRQSKAPLKLKSKACPVRLAEKL